MNFLQEAGQLFENVTVDEHENKVIEYKDKQGLVILKKVQVEASPSSGHDGWLCTYYIYDDLNQLRFVVPPKAIAGRFSFLSLKYKEDLLPDFGHIVVVFFLALIFYYCFAGNHKSLVLREINRLTPFCDIYFLLQNCRNT